MDFEQQLGRRDAIKIWGILLGTACIVWMQSSWHWPAYPGLFVLLLGLIVGLLPLKNTPLSAPEKVVYAIGVLCLVFLEIRTICIADKDSEDRFKDMVGSVTGGESWPIIEMTEFDIKDHPPRRMVPRILIRGTHSLRQVELGVIDYRNYREFFAAKKDLSVEQVFANQHITVSKLDDVRAIATGSLIMFPIGIDTDPDADKRYCIEIHALNGSWREYLQYQKVDGQWKHAIKVAVVDGTKVNGDGPTIMVDVTPGYPTKNGEVNWND
jgi:hypothetical protein